MKKTLLSISFILLLSNIFVSQPSSASSRLGSARVAEKLRLERDNALSNQQYNTAYQISQKIDNHPQTMEDLHAKIILADKNNLFPLRNQLFDLFMDQASLLSTDALFQAFQSWQDHGLQEIGFSFLERIKTAADQNKLSEFLGKIINTYGESNLKNLPILRKVYFIYFKKQQTAEIANKLFNLIQKDKENFPEIQHVVDLFNYFIDPETIWSDKSCFKKADICLTILKNLPAIKNSVPGSIYVNVIYPYSLLKAQNNNLPFSQHAKKYRDVLDQMISSDHYQSWCYRNPQSHFIKVVQDFEFKLYSDACVDEETIKDSFFYKLRNLQ